MMKTRIILKPNMLGRLALLKEIFKSLFTKEIIISEGKMWGSFFSESK